MKAPEEIVSFLFRIESRVESACRAVSDCSMVEPGRVAVKTKSCLRVFQLSNMRPCTVNVVLVNVKESSKASTLYSLLISSKDNGRQRPYIR